MKNFKIQNASEQDSSKISELYKIVWDEQKGKFPDELLDARQPDEKEMKRWIKRENYSIAEKNNKIIGVVGYFMEYGNCKLVHMAVLKEFRGHGIGYKLLTEVEEYAKQNHAYKIWLDTSTRLKESIKFYTKNGYKIVGELKKHFWGEDIILLEKEIKY